MTKSITILGATGSIGRAAADVICSAPERFRVEAVTANTNALALAEMAVRLGARRAVLADAAGYKALRDALSGTGIESAAGLEALEEAASISVDIVIAAIVGMAGLRPLMCATKQGRSVAIANKEPLVAAGPLVMTAAKTYGTTILPLDSEHNALFQILSYTPTPARGGQGGGLERVVLTASGGPFWEWSAQRMATATVKEALRHPRWTMGPKISIDCATLVNKALEVIEAHYLFDLPPHKIDVLIHPQSVVHGMAEYADGSVIAHMGPSDMRTPITHALAWPQRMATPGKRLCMTDMARLDFFAPDTTRFPALQRGYEALAAGSGACIAFNAANEVAVRAFLTGRIAFSRIIECIDHALKDIYSPGQDLEAIEALDSFVRQKVEMFIHHT